MEDRFSGQEGSLQSGSVGGKRTRDRGLVGRDGLRGELSVSGPLTDKRLAANWWVSIRYKILVKLLCWLIDGHREVPWSSHTRGYHRALDTQLVDKHNDVFAQLHSFCVLWRINGKFCDKQRIHEKRPVLFPGTFAPAVVGRATNATSTVGVECRTVSCNIALICFDMMFLVVSYRKVSVEFWRVRCGDNDAQHHDRAIFHKTSVFPAHSFHSYDKSFRVHSGVQ